MTRPKPRPIDTGEEPEDVRVEKAVKLYERFCGTLREISIRAAARRHGIANWERVRNRISGQISRRTFAQKRMKLSPFEESVIEKFCYKVYDWGWPASPKHVIRMANEICKVKGLETTVGKNWIYNFLVRHPGLRTRIASPRSMDRIVAQDYRVFDHWFDLFIAQRALYNIDDADIWNMDEKGVALGIAGKQRVIIPKREGCPHTSGGSATREWATTSETISLTGRKLPLWMIFKGAINQDKWHRTMKEQGQFGTGYRIAVSHNGWTNNELGLDWLEFFDQYATCIDSKKSLWRMLIVDGHDSHISSEAIQFCLKKKIVLLCLPPHATHLLQPCDVGIFGIIAQIYKQLIGERYRFGATYHIDKCQFLEIWIEARQISITEKNIRSAWRKSGILATSEGSIDRDIVLSQLAPLEDALTTFAILETSNLRPSTPENLVRSSLFSATPGDVPQVQRVVRIAEQIDLSHIDFLAIIVKLGKAATQAMVENHATTAVNEDLVIASKNREKRSQKNREDGKVGSLARVCGEEEYIRRQEYGSERSLEFVWKSFCHSFFITVFQTCITAADNRSRSQDNLRKKKRLATLARIEGGEEWIAENFNQSLKKRTAIVRVNKVQEQQELPDFADLTLPSLSRSIATLSLRFSSPKNRSKASILPPQPPVQSPVQSPIQPPISSPKEQPVVSRFGRVIRRPTRQ